MDGDGSPTVGEPFPLLVGEPSPCCTSRDCSRTAPEGAGPRPTRPTQRRGHCAASQLWPRVASWRPARLPRRGLVTAPRAVPLRGRPEARNHRPARPRGAPRRRNSPGRAACAGSRHRRGLERTGPRRRRPRRAASDTARATSTLPLRRDGAGLALIGLSVVIAAGVLVRHSRGGRPLGARGHQHGVRLAERRAAPARSGDGLAHAAAPREQRSGRTPGGRLDQRPARPARADSHQQGHAALSQRRGRA